MKGKTGRKVRRTSALKLLEAQLKSGVKPEKINGKTTTNMIPLTDIDRRRIDKNIEVLKSRL